MDEQTEQQSKEGKSLMKNPIVWLGLLLLIGGAGYWAVTSGVSEEFVAKVNGEGIEKRLFDVRFVQLRANYETQGIAFADEDTIQLREQILEDMINERLLIQHAKEQGITGQEELMEEEYQLILSQFENEAELKKQLSDNNTSIQDIRTSISEQFMIRELASQQAEQGDIEISQEEIQQAYDDVVSGGAEVPPLEEVQEQVEEFVRQQKISQLIEVLLEQLRTKSSIEILN